MRVVDAVAEWFEKADIRHYFGYAGGAVWPFLDALVDKPNIVGYQAKHEAHAVHMADIYYRVSGRLAPVIVTKGPGLLNCPGAMANAMHDSAAVLLIAGSGPTHFFGKGGFQEIYYHGFEDAVNVMRPVTKGAWLVVRPDNVIDVLNQAVNVALSGRPGPVFVQLPLDIQLAEVEGEVFGPRKRRGHVRPRTELKALQQVADALRNAERPLILAGGGVRLAGGAVALKKVAEKLQVPVVTTLTGKGVLPENHPLSLGPAGRSGAGCAAAATREADVVLAVGARFSDNHTGNWRQGSIYNVPVTKVYHVDIDPEEIGRNYPVELGIVADAAGFLNDLWEVVKDGEAARCAKNGWLEKVDGFRKAWQEEIRPVIFAESDPIHPARLVAEVARTLPKGGRVFIDVGDVIQYAEPYMEIVEPDAWYINPGLAEMGWAASGHMAALIEDRSRAAVTLVGDGAFNMVSNAVATAVEYDLPAVWVILNNCELGIERKGTAVVYKRLHPWMTFKRTDTGEAYNPDFVKMAEAYGAEGVRVEKASELKAALEKAFASGRPYIVDVKIDPSVPTYFTAGLDRAYPDKWKQTYPAYGQLQIK